MELQFAPKIDFESRTIVNMARVTIKKVDVSTATTVFAGFGSVSGGIYTLQYTFQNPSLILAGIFIGAIIGGVSGIINSSVYNLISKLGYPLEVVIHQPINSQKKEPELIECPHCKALEDSELDTCRFCGKDLSI